MSSLPPIITQDKPPLAVIELTRIPSKLIRQVGNTESPTKTQEQFSATIHAFPQLLHWPLSCCKEYSFLDARQFVLGPIFLAATLLLAHESSSMKRPPVLPA